MDLLESLRAVASKYKTKPSQAFMMTAVTRLQKEPMYVWHKICAVSPTRFNSFPSLRQLEDMIREFKIPVPPPKRYDHRPWVSTRAPGTPPHMEALFLMIEQGKTKTGAFTMKLKNVRMTEDVVWACYEEWSHGRVHEELKRATTPKSSGPVQETRSTP